MQILDVTRNRHLESDGQEIRDFLPHLFCCLSYTYGLRFQVTENVYMYRNKKRCQTICSKNDVTKATSPPITTTSRLIQDIYLLVHFDHEMSTLCL